VEPCVRDYLVEWLSPVLLFFIGTVSFIYRVFSQVQETEFVSEDNIYCSPTLCPFRDILFFFWALLIRFSPYRMFNYTYCSVLLPETIIVPAKKAKYWLCFVPQSVADRAVVKLGSKSIEMSPSSNIFEGSDLKIM